MRCNRLLAAGIATMAIASAASAQTLSERTGTVYRTDALTSAASFTNSLVGMTVTGYDVSGSAFTTQWVPSGNIFGAFTSLFTVFIRSFDNTADAVWRLRAGNAALARLVFNGAPGNTVFDRTFNFTTGTPISSGGLDFQTLPFRVDISAEYSNAVAVGNNVPVGDLFETIDITFGTPVAPGVAVDFMIDTDNAAVNAPLIPVTTTPEPASVALMATGLVAVAMVRRRRRIA